MISDAAPARRAEPSSGWRGISDLGLVGRQTRYEQIAFWRNRTGAVFTVGFSVVFLLLVASAGGNQREAFLGGIRLIQYYVPGFAAYGVMAACFNNLAIVMVVRRETGLLKRLRLTPLPTWVFLSAIFLSAAIVALVQVALMIAIGRLAFSVHLPDHVLPLVIALVVEIVSFSAMGVVVSTLVPNQDAAGPVTSIIFFVFLFLSGLWFPLKPGSGLAKFATWFPFRHFILAVFMPFDVQGGASPWAWHDLAVVAVWGAAGAVIAARRFQWAPKRS